MAKKYRKNRGKLTKTQTTPAPTAMNVGLDSASHQMGRVLSWFPTLNKLEAIDDHDWELTSKRVRSLYNNFPQIRQAVSTLILLTGSLSPRPNTADEDFNRRARAWFLKKCQNPATFSTNKRLNWWTAQRWLELNTILDGDCLTVLVKNTKDGQPRLSFYDGSQIQGSNGWRDGLRTGVNMGRWGEVKSYSLKDYVNEGEYIAVDATRAILYSHHTDALDPRTISELSSAVATCADVKKAQELTLQKIKTNASVSFYETKALGDTNQSYNDLIGGRNRKGATGSDAQTQMAEPDRPIWLNGTSKVLSLSAGRDLKTISDNTPATPTAEFIATMVNNIAHAVGVDPELLYCPSKLSGSSTRFVLQKALDWSKARQRDREVWANRVYQFFIANGIAHGELEAPRPDLVKDISDWFSVEWVNREKWSIDAKYQTSMAISQIEAGLMSADEWTLANYDMTVCEIAEKKAHDVAHIINIAKEYGVPVESLLRTTAGQAPIDWSNTTPDPDKHPEDAEPEGIV